MSEQSPFSTGTVLDELWQRGFIKQSIRPEALQEKMESDQFDFTLDLIQQETACT